MPGGGGVSVVASFIYKILVDSGRYEPELISFAVSSRDSASVRLLSPASWIQRPKIIKGTWEGKDFLHVGCYFSELEFQRYLPRRILTELLEKYDLIQVVSGAPTAGFAVTKAKKPVCIFVATTCKQERGSQMACAKRLTRARIAFMTRLNSSMDRRTVKRMSHVFAESEYTRQLLSEMVCKERLSIAPPGVDIDLFSPGGYRPDNYILSVGRFADPRKNVRMLLLAYYQLLQSIPSTPRLILAGETGPSAEDKALAASLGIADRVIILQNVQLEDLSRLYREASLFVLSSIEEGLGIVILEAMACGIPVIATRCGGPDTVIIDGKTGYLIPVGDVNALAKAMMRLLTDPELSRRMGEAGRNRVENHFSIQAAGKIYLEKYDELLSLEL